MFNLFIGWFRDQQTLCTDFMINIQGP